MTTIKIKAPRLGGYRPRKILRSAQSRLLEVIWKQSGGLKTLQQITGEPAQMFLDWKLNGKVPFKKLRVLVETLNVPAIALNYDDVAEILLLSNTKIPPWRTLVLDTVGLAASSYILKGAPPKHA